jgi:hypothetical protein
MQHLASKAATYMHLSTQGGTSVPQLPLWMSHPAMKPLSIFYRIATHATFDSYINFIKPAIKHHNPFPLLKLAIGHSVSGAALYYVYENVFDRPNPLDAIDISKVDDEQKTELLLRRIFMNAWYSGFFGITETVFNPRDGFLSGSSIKAKIGPDASFKDMPVIMPALLTMSESLLTNGTQLFFEKPGTMDWQEWTVDRTYSTFKEITSLGSGIEKIRLRANNNYMHNRNKIRRLFDQYVTSIGKNKPSGDFSANPMYQSLKMKLTDNKATQEDRVKAIMVVYNVQVHEALMNDREMHPLDAHKKAVSGIKASMNSLRPVFKSGAFGENITETDIQNFYKTLTPEFQKLVYEYDVLFEGLKVMIENILDNEKNYIRYSILGHSANMLNVDYTPNNKMFQKNFYDSLDDEDKKLYKGYRSFY